MSALVNCKPNLAHGNILKVASLYGDALKPTLVPGHSCDFITWNLRPDVPYRMPNDIRGTQKLLCDVQQLLVGPEVPDGLKMERIWHRFCINYYNGAQHKTLATLIQP